MINYKRSTRLIIASFSLLFSVFSSAFVSAQSENQGVIQSQFNNYQQNTLQEKIFVHTDRSSYVAGEIVWFKVYCADLGTSRLSAVSKVAYVEVLDNDLQPVLQAKISLENGTGSGSFEIPTSLHSGNFLLRSYTNWMKNFDPEFYFHQNLTIINTTHGEAVGTIAGAKQYDVQFFPEGGNLVNELKSKVAFRVTDNSGKGVDFNGVILDQNNDTVSGFNPAHFGIGNFSFTPHAGKQYRAIIQTKAGNKINANLPQPLQTGFVLTANSVASNQLQVNIRTTTADRNATIVIHNRKQLVASQLVNITNGSADFQIDKNKLGDGVSTISLFSENNHPVCERLFFKKSVRQLVIGASTDNSQYTTRRKVTLNVASKDETESPSAAEMSVAVFRLDSLPTRHQNIYNYFSMLSDLKGIVENPDYYFDNASPDVEQATDNLMLTHGWRRFKWQDVLENKKMAYKFLPEFEGHIVTARVINKFDQRPAADIVSFLSVPGNQFQLYSAKSKQDGTVHFNTTDLKGAKLIVGQINQAEADSLRIDFANPFSETYAAEKVPVFAIGSNLSSTLLKRSIQMQVQYVYTGEKLNVFQAVHRDTTSFYGKPDARYMLEDYTRFPTMEEVLREYVREVNVRKRRNEFILTTITKDENGIPEVKEPVVLLDGVPQFDRGNKITHYDPLKVKKLEIVQDKFYLGPGTFDGIISFTTYNGDLEGFRLDTSSTVLDYEGLQSKREFYSPRYDNMQESNSRMPDFRSLLYWSPDVKTDNGGKKELSFYTSDIPGKYAVVLQGISKEGKAGSKVVVIEVKKPELTQ